MYMFIYIQLVYIHTQSSLNLTSTFYLIEMFLSYPVACLEIYFGPWLKTTVLEEGKIRSVVLTEL